jgi:hypothetical protein
MATSSLAAHDDYIWRVSPMKSDRGPKEPGLQATLDAGPTGDLAFIANASNGNPRTKESLGNLFAEVCKAAGVA